MVQMVDEKTESVNIKRSVRQECVLSQDLFSLYTQIIVEEMSCLPGIKIGRRNTNKIRYADYKVIMAETGRIAGADG